MQAESLEQSLNRVLPLPLGKKYTVFVIDDP